MRSATRRSTCAFGAIAVLAGVTTLAAPPQAPPRPGPPEIPARSPMFVDEVVAGLAAVGGTWARAIGTAVNDYGNLIRRTADSGFVFAGSFGDFFSGTGDLWLLKTDAAGNRLWEKVYGTADIDFGLIFTASGGGYLLYAESSNIGTGTITAFTLAKLDDNGTILWQKRFIKDGVPTDVLDFATPHPDGGFIVTGSTSTFTPAPPFFVYADVLIKVNSSGTIVWQKEYPRPSTDSLSSFGIQELADHTLLQSGSKFPAPADFTHTDAWLRRLSSTGAVLLDKYIGGPEADGLYAVMPANGGGFIATGTTKSWLQPGDTYGNIWIVKFDASFNIVMQKSFGDTGAEAGSLVALADGYLLSGTVRAASPPAPGGVSAAAIDTVGDVFAIKLDNNLNQIWGKTYDAGGAESGSVQVDSTGGFLLSGSTDANTHGGTDILLAKLDSNGNVTWSRVYGGSGTDTGGGFRLGAFTTFSAGVEAAALADTDIAITGGTTSVGAGGYDMLAAILDSNGQIAGCPFVQNVTLTAAPWTIPVLTTNATVATNTPTSSDITAFSIENSILTTTTRTSTVTDFCTATPNLTATANANRTSGAAPLAVNFTGSATGGTPPYTWEWDFGDGSAKSTQQNPSHTYTDPGSYPVTLTVTDSASATATDTHLTIEVSGACTLLCFATVPATGTAGQPVEFGASAEEISCSNVTTYSWTFGDGGTSTQQGPSHTYAGPGTYPWSVVVSNGSTTCSKNGSITIGGGGTQYVYWVPSAAHAPGAFGSKWRTDMAAVNRSGATANLSLVFVPYGSGSTIPRNHTLANNNTVEWDDVLVSLFNFADSANTKGTVKITSNVPITALSRTYNQAATGTFGQYYPALTEAQGITGSQAAVLPLLRKNATFRTNGGFQNLGGTTCTGEIKLFSGAGAQVGTTRALTAAADKYTQEDDIFTKAGAGTQDVAYARVQSMTAGCKLWFFASVIDGATNDPTTVPQQRNLDGPYWIPSAAHAPGLLGSKWRTDISIVHRAGGTANLTLEFIPYSSGATVTRNHTLANNTAVEWDDVLVSLFGFADSANTKGTVKITSDKAIFGLSRTYNLSNTGTFGQYYPMLTAAAGITNGQTAVLPLLRKSATFRTNGAHQNLGTGSCTGTFKLFNAAGAQVGSTRTLTALANKYIQDDDIFTKAGAGNQQPAYAVVEVTTAGGIAWFSGSVIDGSTNDPTTVPQQGP